MVLLCSPTLLFAQRSFWWSSSFLVSLNVPRRLEGWPVRYLVISRNYHPAFRLTGQFLLSSSFMGEGSRVWFAVGIWCLHDCLGFRVLWSQFRGSEGCLCIGNIGTKSGKRVWLLAYPALYRSRGQPQGTANQSDSTRSRTIYGSWLFSLVTRGCCLVHPGSEPYHFAVKYLSQVFKSAVFPEECLFVACSLLLSYRKPSHSLSAGGFW